MCGRYGFAPGEFREIKLRFNIGGDLPLLKPRYNIAPSQQAPVIVSGDGENHVAMFRWGLVPLWAKDPSIGNRMINARAETLLEKPSFKRLVATRRCIVPADGFYEWRREGNRKVPVWIHLRKRKPFGFAGLWDHWRDHESAKELDTFTIITCEPNALVRPIHNRMPVVYDREMGYQWLDPKCPVNSSMTLGLILQPYPSEMMEAQDVSTLVNNPQNDSPECI